MGATKEMIIKENDMIIKEKSRNLTPEMIENLRKPFPPEAYSTIDSKPYLTSIKAMYIVERLNEVFGIGRWILDHEVIKEDNNQVLIKGELIIFDYDIKDGKEMLIELGDIISNTNRYKYKKYYGVDFHNLVKF